MNLKALLLVFVALCCLIVEDSDAARRKRRGRRRYSGPPPTHPVVLWSKTLAASTDPEQRKIAAFKLSQYSQTIYQESIINNLIKCMKDSDVEIKVLCAKAMGRAGTQSQADSVRRALIDQYNADPTLRSTIVRTFIIRKDQSEKVHDLFLKSLKTSEDPEAIIPLATYFEENGSGSQKFVDALVESFNKHDNIKLKRSVVKALGAKGQGQNEVVALLASCSVSKDTPLSLNCLSGLQSQARRDPRAWPAVEKAIESSDPDVLMATLDVINSLPEAPKKEIAVRLVEIIDDMDDTEIQEKAVLALGVCGDHTEPTVKALSELLEDKGTDEGVRIAAALVMGRQADLFPEQPQTALTKCLSDSKTQNLRTACELGLQELKARKALAEKNPPMAPVVSVPPASESPAPRTTAENDSAANDAEPVGAGTEGRFEKPAEKDRVRE